jgi:lipoprotein NlpD
MQPADGSAATPQVLPGAENAGKPGYYTVKPGDTLLRIALEAGQNWRDVARWSQLENPNVIEVGQVLRVVPPASEVPVVAAAPAGAVTRPVVPANRGDARPLDGAGPAASAPAGAAVPAAPPAPVLSPEENLNWLWPATGPVIAGFDDVKSKGLAIAGNAGDPVLAAADGRVVYAGSGLRGYGNLVIVKHNNVFLTAYAHNQTLLVKEDQVVRRGQQIAEMGSSDAERVQLHFEIRRQGRPIDPARLLPPR